MSAKRLILVTGPTAVGKSEWCIDLALKYGSPVISCDSRQLYREMTIGTAVPDASQLSAVKHYFIQSHSIHEEVTAGMYAGQALGLINTLFGQGHETLVMAGGSAFYADAVCNGLDEMPSTDPVLRGELVRRIREEGLESLRSELRELDARACGSIDMSNPQRVLRALEVCLLSGRPYSSFRTGKARERDFGISKICLYRPREVLFERINARVLRMADEGLADEVRSLRPFRDLPALRTVGYREIFDWLDREDGMDGPQLPNSLDEALSRIQSNTRRYARKQLTWWKRDPSVNWIEL